MRTQGMLGVGSLVVFAVLASGTAVAGPGPTTGSTGVAAQSAPPPQIAADALASVAAPVVTAAVFGGATLVFYRNDAGALRLLEKTAGTWRQRGAMQVTEPGPYPPMPRDPLPGGSVYAFAEAGKLELVVQTRPLWVESMVLENGAWRPRMGFDVYPPMVEARLVHTLSGLTSYSAGDSPWLVMMSDGYLAQTRLQSSDPGGWWWRNDGSYLNAFAGGAPPAASVPCAVNEPAVPLSHVRAYHVVYRAENNAIVDINRDVALPRPKWREIFPAGKVVAGGTPQAIWFGGQLHTFFSSANGHVYYLSGVGAETDLTDLARAPANFKDGLSAIALGSTQVVFYRGGDGHIHELFASGEAWTHLDLTALADPKVQAVGTPVPYLDGGRLGLVYVGSDGHLHELTSPNAQSWGATDILAVARP